MKPEEATKLAIIFGKSCFNCDHCCCDLEDEESYLARFWCDRPIMKRLTMNKTGVLNCYCEKWIVRDDSN